MSNLSAMPIALPISHSGYFRYAVRQSNSLAAQTLLDGVDSNFDVTHWLDDGIHDLLESVCRFTEYVAPEPNFPFANAHVLVNREIELPNDCRVMLTFVAHILPPSDDKTLIIHITVLDCEEAEKLMSLSSRLDCASL